MVRHLTALDNGTDPRTDEDRELIKRVGALTKSNGSNYATARRAAIEQVARETTTTTERASDAK